MTRPIQTIQTPFKRRFERALKQWFPGIFFVIMCAACVWLSQFQNQKTVLIGEVEVAEFIVASPQAGIVNQVLPDLNDDTDPVYSVVTKGQLIVRLDDGTVQQTLNDLQDELLSLSRSVNIELARIDSTSGMRKAPVRSETGSVLKTDSEVADQKTNLTNEMQAWRLGAAAIERQLKQVDLTRQQLQLRNASHQLSSLTRSSDVTLTDTDIANHPLQTRKNELELAVARLSTDLAFGGTGKAGGKLLSAIDESGLSPSGRSLFSSLRRRCQLLQSRLAATIKLASSLDIVSPVAGQIDKAHVSPLQSIAAGQPVVNIVPNQGAYVIGYAREKSALRPVAGMKVALRSLADPTHRFESRVESVGPKVESIPERQRVNPRIEEWGRPVRIPIPDQMAAQPGSAIAIEFVIGHPSE
jgi:multidrug resistance efflux pump